MDQGTTGQILTAIGGAIGAISAALVTYWKLRDKKLAKDKGLADNPERCGQHEEAIAGLKDRMDDMERTNREDHRELTRQISALAIDVAGIGRRKADDKA